MSDFDLKNFIIKTLRGAFKKTPAYHAAKARAKEEYYEKTKHGKDRRRVRFVCQSCGGRFYDRKGAKEIAVDHIIPVIDLERGWVSYEEYINRLFCPPENLQVLCNYAGLRNGTKSCHKIKTASERAAAAESRKKQKENS